MTITLRTVKGSALTHVELDGNFTDLDGRGVATDSIWDAAGDLAVGTGSNTASRLSIGSALQVLRVNSGATGLEWAAVSGGTLETVTITDAAVSMTANRRYVGSIAAFTADRNYTVPAGTAGDVIEIQLTTGDDAFELIILGATGVQINGGTAATEWSRLFISGEFVRLRCVATNDWWVEVDGRKPQQCELWQSVDISNHYAHNAYTKVPVDTIAIDNANIGSLASETITPRRTGKYLLECKVRSTAVTGIDAMRVFVGATGELLTVDNQSTSGGGRCVQRTKTAAGGSAIYFDYFQNSGAAVTARGSTDRPNLIALHEVFE
jgi:hypothetical protein